MKWLSDTFIVRKIILKIHSSDQERRYQTYKRNFGGLKSTFFTLPFVQSFSNRSCCGLKATNVVQLTDRPRHRCFYFLFFGEKRVVPSFCNGLNGNPVGRMCGR
jgi:hypothetical protein